MANEPRNVTIKQLGGSAIVERLNNRISMYEGMKLKSNDIVYVTRGTGVTIDLDEKHSLFAEAGSEFAIILTEDKRDDSTQVRIERGSVLFSINKSDEADVKFSVDTSTLNMEVKVAEGAEKVLFYVTAEQDTDASTRVVKLSTLEGCVEITRVSEPTTVKQMKDGEAVYLSVSENGEVEWREEAVSLLSFSRDALTQLDEIISAGRLLCVSHEEVIKERESRNTLQTSSGRVEAVLSIPTPTIMLTSTPTPTPTPTPTIRATGTPIVTPTIVATVTPSQVPTVTPIITPTPTVMLTQTPKPNEGTQSGNSTPRPTGRPNSTVTPQVTATPTVSPMEQIVPEVKNSEMGGVLSALLGQTPVVNDKDDICTYYEFAEGILLAAEPVIQAEEKKPEEILTKFVFQLILSGVDINKIDINAPITRSEAALIIYFAAQSIGYSGSQTEIVDATSYVTDLSDSTVFEKKTIGYLYQEGYLTGFKVSGQKFSPKQTLPPATAQTWIKHSEESWLKE